MDTRLLEAFQAVVDNGSVTRAATVLGVTQPAVSAQIARLEAQVGFALFERTSGRLKPTQDALLFYAEVSKTLNGFDRLVKAADHIRGGRAGQIVVASHPSAAISLLPDLVAEFMRTRGDVTVKLITRSSDVVRNLIPPESFDVGVAELPIDSSSVKLARFRMRCMAVLRADHPLAGEEVLTPDLLSGQPFVAMFRAHMTFHRVQRAFAEAGARWNVCAEAEFFASACGLAAAGAGITVVDPFTAATFAHRDLVARAFEPMIGYEIGVFRALEREPSRLAAAFWDLVTARLNAYAEEIGRIA